MENKKKLRFAVIHRIILVVSAAMLSGGMVLFLISYSALPERIGVHFGSDGQFDVYSYKIFGFYPYIAGGVLIALFGTAGFLASKTKDSKKLDKTGNIISREAVRLLTDLYAAVWAFFFTNWSVCVTLQTGINTSLMMILLMLCFFAFFAVIGAVAAIRIKCALDAQ